MNYLERLKKLQSILKSEGLDLMIIEEPINVHYLTGLQLSAGKLLVDTESAALFVDGRYIEACRKHSPYPVWGADREALIHWFGLPEKQDIALIGFDSSKSTYKKYLEWQEIFYQLSAELPSSKIKQLLPIDNPISRLRMIKEESEIHRLREAAKLGSKGFDFVCSLLKEGISEMEIATELEIFWKRQGGQALAFESIIAFSSNSSMPHYRPRETFLSQGNSVLIDIGVKVLDYHSDMTRTVFFGQPSEKMSEIYGIVLEAQLKALALCRPGTLIEELDKAARDLIASRGYADNFSHNLGHGVGLEIHEPPTISQKLPDAKMSLQEGMIITIEPGIYLPNIGGVRIEDTILISADGYEDLTARAKNLLVI